MPDAQSWVPDILGEPYEQLTLELGDDAEGPVVATLVRAGVPASDAPLADVDVLYVHGWSDYFFQTALADFWTDLGARFFALDLRKYDDDIAAALDAMGTAGLGRRLVVIGHSTGGLTLTLWAARHPGVVSAVVLNSPWLELQTGAIGRQALAPLVSARAKFDPLGSHPVVDLGFYTRAQRELGTLPESPDNWRPERGFPTHPGWFAAVLAGHATVAAGLDIDCPVLVLLSKGSTPPIQWSEAMTTTDSVLVVADIARAATRLGDRVSVVRVKDAIHDVMLSGAEPRARVFAALRAWLIAGVLV